MQIVTSSGTSEAEYIALPEAVEEAIVLRQKVQNFVELPMRMLHRRRAGPSALM